ncbi:MAG: TVP38/TMEM64 family protein [Thermogemmata sp.]|uniref:TVP38/TMEM64 family membrane protein n=1 Tax=Thermogemmata fonticola TaxID=2755323 RepID=A0A7V9AD91_9BACT|nr:TVP38/TMEM64 family protein [Thermogemmata fonticola]MBA2227783.1 TVP38/TMEM64 family protein [Thermogemmata fonticola]MCX8138295.1 TVP38/TMEM64 family protein [Gemmataceae bacterium]GIW83720.1 MAG: hypothetical protein KatS3mg106_233 [Gemmataceae bacterium]
MFRRYLRVALVGLLILLALLLGRWLEQNGWLLAAYRGLENLDRPAAAVLFVVFYILAVLLLLPAWPLAVAGGAWFGLGWGFVLCTIAANLSASLAFLLARGLGRGSVERFLKHRPAWQHWDSALGRSGWRLVALLRLSPAIPFNLQNYLYGLTAIRFWPCAAASFLAMMPGTFLYVYLGYWGRWTWAGATTEQRSLGEWFLFGLGLAATVLVTIYLGRLARQALQQHIPPQSPAPSPSAGSSSG